MTARVWHTPSAFAWALLIVGVAIFCALGTWQLDRKAQKEKFLAAFANAANTSSVNLASVRDTTDDTIYPHASVAGHFVANREYWYDEQFHAGQPGVRVIDAFQTDIDVRPLLVDRGWVAWNHAPNSSPTIPAIPTQPMQLTGIYAPFPGGGIRVGGDPLPHQTNWPKLTLHVDPNEIANDLGAQVLPRLLLLDPDANSGFVREWTPNVMPPERHLAYAVQWFALAAAALVIFVVRHWRKVDNATK